MHFREPNRLAKPCQGRRDAYPTRRGIAIVLVLGLLAITLAISYATLRGQGAATQLARNNGRSYDAREAAHSGIAAAIRKMSENAWVGVATPLSANITANAWYNVTFTTGDAKLGSTDASYNEWPYRVTIDSIGTASDPTNTTIQAQHHSRVVVQLVRKLMTTEPAIWPSLTGATVYQWGNGSQKLQFPVRINGSAVVLGKVNLVADYPTSATLARNQYLTDLNGRRSAGLGDYRPLPSPLTIAWANQDATNQDLLQNKLGLTINNTTTASATPISYPTGVTSYTLYPGGATWTIPALDDMGNPLSGVTLGPDPKANPLGIFRCKSSLTIKGNTKITGTIITPADIQVDGTNIVFQPNSLPLMNGSSQTYQLPMALVQTDWRMYTDSDVQIGGFAMVWNQLELKYGTPTTKFALTGNLAANSLSVRGRSATSPNNQWGALSNTDWTTQYVAFNTNLALGLADPNRVAYFPDYLQKNLGMTVQPTLTFSASSSGVKPHWQDWSQPIFLPDTADPGLRWDVVRWEDNL